MINEYDLIFLCETWLSDSERLDISNFEILTSFSRKTNIGVRREGGISVYCKPYIYNGIIVEKILTNGIVLVKLKKDFFHMQDDMYICFVYIPHERSSFYSINDCDFFNCIESIFLEYCNKGSVFVCGDFNSRTGLINDILPSDNLDRYIDVMWHDEVPNIPTRCSLDTIANRFGKLLIQLCYNTGLTICNGRLGNDRDGKFTFCSPNGRSLIDYMLASPNDYDKISNFGILNINEFSDLSPLVFEVGIKTVTEENLPKVSSFINGKKIKRKNIKLS